MQRFCSILISSLALFATSGAATAELLLFLDGAVLLKAVEPDGSNLCEISTQGSERVGFAIDNQSRTYFHGPSRWIFREEFGQLAWVNGIDTGQWVADCDVDWVNQKLYWGNNEIVEGELVGSIRRCDLDFSNIETIVEGTTSRHLALDPQNNHVYWTDWRAGDRILRADLDGNHVTEVIVRTTDFSTTSRHRARGLALDFVNDKIYWTEGSFGVFRANADGTDIEHLIDAVLPGAIIVDETNSKIIFAIANPTISPSLFKADLDGTNMQLIVNVSSFVSDLEFADIDPSITGDMNWDNQIDIDDLMVFVDTLLNPVELQCNRQRADINGDGDTNGLDIASFVNCLLIPCL